MLVWQELFGGTYFDTRGVEGPRQGMDCDGGRRMGRDSGNCEEPDETKNGDGEGEREWQRTPKFAHTH